MSGLLPLIVTSGLAAGITLVGVLVSQLVARRGQDLSQTATLGAQEDDALAKAATAALATTQRLEALVDRQEGQLTAQALAHEQQVTQIRAEGAAALAAVRAEVQDTLRDLAQALIWLHSGSTGPAPAGLAAALAEAERIMREDGHA